MDGLAYVVDSLTISPHGFLARTDDGSLVAVSADSSGTKYRIIQGGTETFSVAVPAPG